MNERGDVTAWRLQTLLDAGYPVPLAEQLATATHVDLHFAVELITVRKCAPELAGRVLL